MGWYVDNIFCNHLISEFIESDTGDTKFISGNGLLYQLRVFIFYIDHILCLYYNQNKPAKTGVNSKKIGL